MNKNRYQAAFGEAPEGFVRRMACTLETAKEEKTMVRHGARLGLAIAILLILAMGVAYAVVSQYGLHEFLGLLSEGTLPPEAQEATRFDEPLATVELEGMTFTVTGAVADGHSLYLAGLMTPAQADMVLMGGGEEIRDIAPETLAGKRLFAPHMSSRVNGTEVNTYANRRLEDGSLAMLNVIGPVEMQGEQADLLVSLSVSQIDTADREAEGQGAYVAGSGQQQFLTLQVPVTPPLETLTVACDAGLPPAGMTLHQVSLARTPITTYYTIRYTFEEDSPLDARTQSEAFLILTDAAGDALPTGTLGGTQTLPGDAYTAIGSLAMDHLPETLWMKLVYWQDGQLVDASDAVQIRLDGDGA